MKQSKTNRWWNKVVPASKKEIEKLMATVAELKGQIDAISAQLDKASAEILAEIKTLEDKLANTTIPDDAQASIDSLKAKVQALDDINPDQPPTP